MPVSALLSTIVGGATYSSAVSFMKNISHLRSDNSGYLVMTLVITVFMSYPLKLLAGGYTWTCSNCWSWACWTEGKLDFFLRELGCDIVQGYYVARPQEEDSLWEFLQLHNKRQANHL